MTREEVEQVIDLLLLEDFDPSEHQTHEITGFYPEQFRGMVYGVYTRSGGLNPRPWEPIDELDRIVAGYQWRCKALIWNLGWQLDKVLDQINWPVREIAVIQNKATALPIVFKGSKPPGKLIRSYFPGHKGEDKWVRS